MEWTGHKQHTLGVSVSHHPQMGLSSCRKTISELPLILHYGELYNYFTICYKVIIEIKYTINVMCSLKRFYLFVFRERGREGKRGEGKEKEKNINVWLPLKRAPLGTWPATQAGALAGNWTGDPLVCRTLLCPLSHISQGEFNVFESSPNHAPTLWAMEILSSTKPVPGTKKVKDCCSNQLSYPARDGNSISLASNWPRF